MIMSVVLLSCCKPEEGCEPVFNTIDPELWDAMPDEYYPKLIFTNSDLGTTTFHYSYVYHNKNVTSNDTCKPRGEHLSLRYFSYEFGTLEYEINSVNPIRIQINTGYIPTGGGCLSFFPLDISDTASYVDTLERNGKVFTNLIYKPGPTSFCMTELYYSKLYGLVAFSWEGEWYVLEKDSLQ